jgi:hypothetical protein
MKIIFKFIIVFFPLLLTKFYNKNIWKKIIKMLTDSASPRKYSNK